MLPHLQVQGGIKMTYLEALALLSLSSPDRIDDSPFLNKAILPHPIHVLCLDFSIWNARTKIF
jgi:hypothetical protein